MANYMLLQQEIMQENINELCENWKKNVAKISVVHRDALINSCGKLVIGNTPNYGL